MRQRKGSSKGTGPSFCHHCGKQLQYMVGGGFHFTLLLTPGDRLPVRIHKTICPEQALTDGYARATNA